MFRGPHTEETKKRIGITWKRTYSIKREMYRKGSLDMRFRSGNPHGGLGYIDWLKENYCIHCEKTCMKGLYKCPDCHLRVRIVPHNHMRQRELFEGRRRLIKQAQTEAAMVLQSKGWILLPPACVTAH